MSGGQAAGVDGQAAELTPLQMAQNCVAAVRRVADWQDRDPLGARVSHAGEQGHQSAQLGACMALVSIAESLDRIAALLGGGPGPLPQNHVDDAGHVLDDAGHVLDGGAGQ